MGDPVHNLHMDRTRPEDLPALALRQAEIDEQEIDEADCTLQAGRVVRIAVGPCRVVPCATLDDVRRAQAAGKGG